MRARKGLALDIDENKSLPRPTLRKTKADGRAVRPAVDVAEKWLLLRVESELRRNSVTISAPECGGRSFPDDTLPWCARATHEREQVPY